MCGRLVNLDTVARVIADYYHLKTDTQLAALDEALSKVPAVSVGGGHGKDHVGDPGKMVGDLISRAEALEAMDTWDKFGCDPDGKLVRYDDDKHYVPYVHYEDMVHVIKALSSAQPEIIRCKYCRHGVDYYKEGDCYCTNPKWGLKYFGGSWEFYCADAERKAPGTRV